MNRRNLALAAAGLTALAATAACKPIPGLPAPQPAPAACPAYRTLIADVNGDTHGEPNCTGHIGRLDIDISAQTRGKALDQSLRDWIDDQCNHMGGLTFIALDSHQVVAQAECLDVDH